MATVHQRELTLKVAMYLRPSLHVSSFFNVLVSAALAFVSASSPPRAMCLQPNSSSERFLQYACTVSIDVFIAAVHHWEIATNQYIFDRSPHFHVFFGVLPSLALVYSTSLFTFESMHWCSGYLTHLFISTALLMCTYHQYWYVPTRSSPLRMRIESFDDSLTWSVTASRHRHGPHRVTGPCNTDEMRR